MTNSNSKLKHFIGQPWKAALLKYKHMINTHRHERKWNEMKACRRNNKLVIRYALRVIPMFLPCTRVYWYSCSNLKSCSLICSMGTYVYIHVLVHTYTYEHTPIHSQICIMGSSNPFSSKTMSCSSYVTYTMVMMTWLLMEPGHQLPDYWPSYPRIFWLQHLRGLIAKTWILMINFARVFKNFYGHSCFTWAWKHCYIFKDVLKWYLVSCENILK